MKGGQVSGGQRRRRRVVESDTGVLGRDQIRTGLALLASFKILLWFCLLVFPPNPKRKLLNPDHWLLVWLAQCFLGNWMLQDGYEFSVPSGLAILGQLPLGSVYRGSVFPARFTHLCPAGLCKYLHLQPWTRIFESLSHHLSCQACKGSIGDTKANNTQPWF